MGIDDLNEVIPLIDVIHRDDVDVRVDIESHPLHRRHPTPPTRDPAGV